MTSSFLVFRLAGGGSITLDQRLGGGGEGTVFSVAGRPDVVAKIYNAPMTTERRAKIEAMLATAPASILPATAWPSELIVNGREAVGFLMPRVANASEAHVLYGLKSRRQKFPGASFRFLIHVATNLARAFALLHSAGIVVGDVNERVAMVATDGTVRVIDCDSFQIRHGAKLFGCDVGTPIFTAPELQNVSTFRGIERTPQHDLFGLAVLLFHLLFLGRHPFSGRCLAVADMPIEKAIQEHRFAYSSDNGRTQMQPPPHTPPMGYSGGTLTGLFERAFSPATAKGQAQRPSAAQWAETLSAFLAQLTPCKVNASHAYVPANGPCPWCAIELTTRIDLFSYVEPAAGSATAAVIDYEAIWRAIDGLMPFRVAPAPDPAHVQSGLNPSPEAQRVSQTRAEQAAIARARQEVAGRKQALAALNGSLIEAEQAAAAAHEYANSFESDGLRLLKLQHDSTAAIAKAERYKLFQWLTPLAAVPAAGLAFLPLQNINVGLIPLGVAALTFVHLANQRRQLQVAARKNGVEVHTLRLSIDQGPELRHQLAAKADQMLAEIRGRVAAQHAEVDNAFRTYEAAQKACTLSEGQLEATVATFTTRYTDLQRQGGTIATKRASLDADLTRGWHDIQDRKRNAQTVCDAIRRFDSSRAAARQRAHDDARAVQLNAYLDQFFINQETWPRIPKSALSALASYSIETAADITEAAVRAVPGFGDVRTGILMEWRRRKATGFRFDAAQVLHSPQLQQEERRLMSERRQSERDLVRIKAQIDAVKAGLEHQIGKHEHDVKGLVAAMAQAMVDANTMQLRLPVLTLRAPAVHVRASPSPPPPPTPPPQPTLTSTTPSNRYTWRQQKKRTNYRKRRRRF